MLFSVSNLIVSSVLDTCKTLSPVGVCMFGHTLETGGCHCLPCSSVSMEAGPGRTKVWSPERGCKVIHLHF